jgi:hypothetical protein
MRNLGKEEERILSEESSKYEGWGRKESDEFEALKETCVPEEVTSGRKWSSEGGQRQLRRTCAKQFGLYLKNMEKLLKDF